MRPTPSVTSREAERQQRFARIWSEELNAVFADVARYYDRANVVASLGLWSSFLKSFLATVELNPGERVLDVCGGTNAVGVALLRREPTLEVQAIDRSAAMQAVGRQRAAALGLRIGSTIGDAHRLPFPDDHFDLVTLQYASRHLRLGEVFGEIYRVLRPGGRFYHSDMLRPPNRLVERLYYAYLRCSLAVSARIFRSASPTRNCRQYFIEALELYYTAEEICSILREQRFADVSAKTVLFGMVGFHRAVKPTGQ